MTDFSIFDRKVEGNSSTPLVGYANDPVAFCRDILGFHPYKAQEEVLTSLICLNRVCAAGEPMVGLTSIGAAACLWWTYTRLPGLAVVVCPTKRQLRSIFLRELKRLHKYAKVNLPGRMVRSNLNRGDGWGVVGLVGGQANAIAGMMCGPVLLVLDEAGSLSQDSVDFLGGITACLGSRELRLGKLDTLLVSELDEQQGWYHHSIYYEDTPNHHALMTIIPGLATPEFMAEYRSKSGAL